MEKNGKEILRKQAFFLGSQFVFRYLPEFLGPKCYTWLESYGSEDPHISHIFGVTIWLMEFCQHFGIQIITPAHTLSYQNFGVYLYLNCMIFCITLFYL